MASFNIDAKFGALVLAGLFLVVVGQIVPFIGAVVEGSYDMPVDTAGTGTYTASGVAINNEIITIGSETYTVSNTTSGAFYLLNATNASNQIAYLVTEINANSTLVTASAATAANATTITSVLEIVAGNYATTENMTNGAFGATAMTGAVTGSEWEDVTAMSTVWTTLVSILGGALSLAGIFYAISPIIGKSLLGKD